MTEHQAWLGGETWVFQGTVAEDATVGTHISSLTITPGAGNEMQIQGGYILVGNTATAQTATAVIDDGTNVLEYLVNSMAQSGTTALTVYPLLNNGLQTTANLGGAFASFNYPAGYYVSGTMRLILKVSTTAVSVTQTFAVVCRIHGHKPTATLADTVGTPTLTTNTSAVF